MPLHVNFVPLPDLVVTDVAAPAHVLIGQPFTATYTVTNTGVGAVPDRQSTWVDYVYLSRDQFLDVNSDPIPWTVKHVGVLAPNGTYTVDTGVEFAARVDGSVLRLCV